MRRPNAAASERPASNWTSVIDPAVWGSVRALPVVPAAGAGWLFVFARGAAAFEPAAAWAVRFALAASAVVPLVPTARFEGMLSRLASLVVSTAAGAVVAVPDVPTAVDGDGSSG